MKAVVFHEHGGPEVLRYTDVTEPRIHANEVLVRVRAVALNHLDLWVRRGLSGVSFAMPHIPGSDVAGEIEKVGELVKNVHVGQKVVLSPGVSCGQCEHCSAGDDNLCRQYTLIGYGTEGGCAEFVRAPGVNAIPMPENLSFEQAAAIPLVFLTAWHMLIARARLTPGEDVLVIAGGSGVGSAAIQIAKMMGAHVIATVGTLEKAKKAKELGADESVLHSEPKFSNEVKRITARRGVDVVFEHVGQATWDQSMASLKPGGRLVTCGATTGYDARIDIRFLFSRNLSVLGSYMGRRDELYKVMGLVARGKLHAVVDRVLPLQRCAEAHAAMERREHFGKIVLTP